MTGLCGQKIFGRNLYLTEINTINITNEQKERRLIREKVAEPSTALGETPGSVPAVRTFYPLLAKCSDPIPRTRLPGPVYAI